MTYRKFLFISAGLCASLLAQTKRSDIPPQTVVAEIDGKQITAGELNQFVGAMGGQAPAFFDAQPKEFMKQLALLLHFAKLAEQEKLDQQAPVKQQLEYARLQVLMQGLMNYKMNALQLNEDQVQKYYDEHKPEYSQVYSKVLYVTFGADGKPRTDAEAKARIEELRKQAAAGGDFLKIIKENSDDPTTRDKDGDYQPISRASALPDLVKGPVLQLKPGEYSQPIRQGNGYYVFRVEKLEPRPLDQVRNEVTGALRQASFRTWFETVRASIEPKFLNEDYFKPNPNAAPPMPPGVKPAAPPPAKSPSLAHPKH